MNVSTPQNGTLEIKINDKITQISKYENDNLHAIGEPAITCFYDNGQVKEEIYYL